MRASFQQIETLVRACGTVPGDFAEFGVWQGTTFLPLADAAKAYGKRCHAVDSFRGCAEPSAEDREVVNGGRLVCEYPKGCLSVDGSRLFRQLVLPYLNVRIWEGWVPAILNLMAAEVEALAFAHVDLDHYLPTLAALRWCWARMSPGGILCAQDWFAGRNWLSAGAIAAFAGECGAVLNELPSGHAWFQKG
jgi:hypothetical protein